MLHLFRKKNKGTKTKKINGFQALKTDMHSHLLPGIDDGSPDTDTSIGLIKGLMELGYSKFITTPHIYSDLFPNTADTVSKAYDKLHSSLHRAGIKIDIKAAAEYFMDEHFSDLLAKNVPFLTLKDNLVLVEISFMNAPFDLKEKIFNLQMKGYQPVMAHPERYGYYHQAKEKYHELKSMGCLMQVNLLSLTGYYGKPVAETAKWLMKNNLIDLFGTDLHHANHLDALNNTALFSQIEQYMQEAPLLNPSL